MEVKLSTISTRLSPNEKAEIEKRAEENLLSLSDYVSDGLRLEELYLEHPFRLILTALRRIYIC